MGQTFIQQYCAPKWGFFVGDTSHNKKDKSHHPHSLRTDLVYPPIRRLTLSDLCFVFVHQLHRHLAAALACLRPGIWTCSHGHGAVRWSWPPSVLQRSVLRDPTSPGPLQSSLLHQQFRHHWARPEGRFSGSVTQSPAVLLHQVLNVSDLSNNIFESVPIVLNINHIC